MRSASVRITRETLGGVYYLTEGLNNCEVQSLDPSDVSGVRMMKPFDMMAMKLSDTKMFADEWGLPVLSEILYGNQHS